MDNRPHGREKHVTGEGKGVYKRGEGLGTGPVGKEDGYSNNGGSSSGGERSDGRSPLGIIIALLIMLLGGGGVGLNGLLGGDGETPSGGNAEISQSFSDIGSMFFGGGSSVSTGWVSPANTGTLNTSVAAGAREKRTNIIGGGNDTVTLMVYMCGTDLESRSGMATSDLQEMAAADIGENVNVIVYTGGCRQWKNNIISNRVNQIYKIENGGMRCLVKDDGSAALTKPSTLEGFIKYCKKNFPANRNELILWDHGGGSLSGYGYDEKNASAGSMTLKGINDALSGAGASFDFIGYDACLMATLENALMLDKYADYLIASEETEPGVGWYYTNWLTELSHNTSIPTVEIGKKIVDDFVSVCNQKCPGQKTTLSVIDLAELSATTPTKFKDFSSSTAKLISDNGYKTVSDARSSAREFAPSTKIDQIDLVNLAYNLGTNEGKELADALKGAVKYNKTSPNMTNAYGISIYFPYKRTSKVDSAVAAYKAIGIDSEYARCIQSFASMEVSGQAASGGYSSPFETLFGSGAPSGGNIDIAGLLSGLLGGDFSGIEGLSSANTGFFGKNFDIDNAVDYISENRLDRNALVWTEKDGKNVISLSEKQWSMVKDLQLNVFFDDGEGYIDLGLDNVYEFTDKGDLIGDYDGTWIAIDSQPVPYYYVDSVYEGEDDYSITGRVPVLLNGERAELIIIFDDETPFGYIAGARSDYINGETETVAKSLTELSEGDKIDFVCDYYSYDGEYNNSYLFGEQMIYTGDHEISNVYIDQEAVTASYMFRDIYNNEYMTPDIMQLY